MTLKDIFPRRNETTIINEAGVELSINASGVLAMTGTVTFPSAQSVVFDSAQDVNVSFPAVQTVDFDGVQSVQFDATQNVNISSTTGNVDVEIKNVAAVAVDASGSTVPISVAGTVSVDASGATVPISHAGALSVAFDGTQEVNIASTTSALSVAFDGTQNVNISAGTVDATIQNSSIDMFSTSSNVEQHKVSVTNSSTTQSWTNAIKAFLFYNDGSEDVHINFGGAATTNHLKIVRGASFSLDYATQDTRFITASGTATIYAIGVW